MKVTKSSISSWEMLNMDTKRTFVNVACLKLAQRRLVWARTLSKQRWPTRAPLGMCWATMKRRSNDITPLECRQSRCRARTWAFLGQLSRLFHVEKKLANGGIICSGLYNSRIYLN